MGWGEERCQGVKRAMFVLKGAVNRNQATKGQAKRRTLLGEGAERRRATLGVRKQKASASVIEKKKGEGKGKKVRGTETASGRRVLKRQCKSNDNKALCNELLCRGAC